MDMAHGTFMTGITSACRAYPYQLRLRIRVPPLQRSTPAIILVRQLPVLNLSYRWNRDALQPSTTDNVVLVVLFGQLG